MKVWEVTFERQTTCRVLVEAETRQEACDRVEAEVRQVSPVRVLDEYRIAVDAKPA